MAGLTWPLHLFFLVTLAASLVAYFGGELPQQPKPDAAFWLLLAAIISGGILFVPKLLLYIKAPNVEKVSDSLRAATAEVAKLTENYQKLADDYEKLSGQLAVFTDAATATKSIDTRLTALDAASETTIKAMGDVKTALDAIKAKTDTIK